MSNDVMDLIRDVNPVPDELPAPPIQPVLRRLEGGDQGRGSPARRARRPNLGETVGALGGATAVALAVLAIALLGHSQPRTATPNAATSTVKGSLTLRATEVLRGQDVTDGSIAGTGRFLISGFINDHGTVTDYRTVNGNTALLRRVAVGKKGTITFLITIDLTTGRERWRITSGTGAYKGLNGHGTEVLDEWWVSPAHFKMVGAASE